MFKYFWEKIEQSALTHDIKLKFFNIAGIRLLLRWSKSYEPMSIILDFLNKKWMINWVKKSVVKFPNFKENLSEVLFFIGSGFRWCQSKPWFKNLYFIIVMTLTFRVLRLSVWDASYWFYRKLFKSIKDRIENIQKNLKQSIGRLIALRTLYKWRRAILKGKQNYWSRETLNLKIEPIMVTFWF